jgi:hypothetical protein
MKLKHVGFLLLVILVLSYTFRHRGDRTLVQTLSAEQQELQQTKVQLQQAINLLADAENKLGFLSRHKSKVQVTAYTGQGSFANGQHTASSFAVPKHSLPEDAVLSVALSPAARRNLNARMNDFIVLFDSAQRKKVLARFVDLTSEAELRPVVDVFFANHAEAKVFGRRHFFAVNISTQDSPFSEE